ncbi:MAG: MBL fold metallo-hydrolase [Nitrospirota bacterium]|nr:MBL fold metallo-hydrolase [Nitrospirota bacterium]
MRMISLQSGSNGNCIYVESGDVRLLFDAGISGSAAEERLAHHGRDIRKVQAVIVSHDHGDHIRSAGIFQRKYGIPLFVTPRTLSAAQGRCNLGVLKEIQHFRSGSALRFGTVAVHTVPTPHDGEDGVIFIVDNGSRRLGIMTDLGHVFSDLGRLIASCDAVLLESNYDPHMLANGPYPKYLKQRIKGPRGHISNREAAELLGPAFGSRLSWARLGHLSEQNNSPEVALRTFQEVCGSSPAVGVASRYAVSDVLEV